MHPLILRPRALFYRTDCTRRSKFLTHALYFLEVISQQMRLSKTYANLFTNSYFQDEIEDKRKQVLDRWQSLKEALIEKRKAISELGTLQQFSRDADEIENWMLEKLVEVEEALDATNIQSKHQKHEKIEMEIKANEDRIKSVLAMGENLIDRNQCAGSEDAVKQRLESISSQKEVLWIKTSEKSMKLKEANRQRTFIAAVKDLDFWLGEVESLLNTDDVGKDLASVLNLMKKHQLVDADIESHKDRMDDMNVSLFICHFGLYMQPNPTENLRKMSFFQVYDIHVLIE